MKAKLFLKLLIVTALFMGGTQIAHAQSPLPPERPSGYYGEINFVTSDDIPTTTSTIEAYVPDITDPVVSSSISEYSDGLVYRLKVLADNPDTTEKDGGVSGDDVTFKIDGRIVAVASDSWLDGSMTMINIHPPKASASGPTVAVVGEEVSFTGSAEDTLLTDTFTYAWDLDGDGAFDDSTDQNPTHTYTTAGSYTATLRVRDSQGGEGYASVEVVVVSLSGLTGQEYDGTAKSVTIGGLENPYSSTVTYDESETAPTAAGTYTVVITILNGTTEVGTVTETMTIDQRPISISAEPKEKTYGDGDPEFTYQVIGDPLVTGDSWSGALSRVSGENIGSYAIEQGSLTAGPNYIVSFTGANLTINKRPITVTADDKSKDYDTADPALTYQITVGSLAFEDSITGNLVREDGEGVGIYAILQGNLAIQDGNSGLNYNLTFEEGVFTIKLITTASISISNLDQEYDGQPKPVTVTTDPVGLSYSVTYNGLSQAPVTTGEYAVVAQITDENYAADPATGALVIRATQTLTLQPGWNLISFNLTPYPPSKAPVDLFADIPGNYDLVYAWDPVDLFADIPGNYDLVYAWDPVDGWLLFDNNELTLDTLTEIDETMGLWVHITADTTITLEMKGFFPTDPTVVLAEGWNLVGFPRKNSQDTVSAIGTLTFERLFGYRHTDTEELWLVYDPAVPAYVNDLATLTSGSGYWIKVTGSVNWVIAYE